MNAAPSLSGETFELLDERPVVSVAEAEYRRLLGYPGHHVPEGRAGELAAWARQWYAENGRPWVYLREVELAVADGPLRIDGVEFYSPQLHEHLRAAGAQRAVLVAVSAGRACEEHARLAWQEAKPDEYFFLEVFGSAVVEHLVATLSGRVCACAERDGLVAVPHYSPGYTGWDIADQAKLLALIARNRPAAFPEPLEVLASGMLRPKKSLLAVVGLAPRSAAAPGRSVPCVSCALTPCQYRRAAYRHAPGRAELQPAEIAAEPAARAASYSLSPRALRKWSQERVSLEANADGTLAARFRFDGTTCSNLGRPLAYDYRVTLSAPENGRTILAADCRPAAGDDGYTAMCAYQSDAAALSRAIAEEKPLLGRPLDDVLGWERSSASSGCYCTPETRAHKWGLALEAIHFTLAQRPAGPAGS